MQTAEWVFRENRLARVSFPALGRPALLSAVEAPIFVLAAADDEVVSLPQATAAKSLCRRTRVKIRIAPGRHLSLFMGRRTVGGVWRENRYPGATCDVPSHLYSFSFEPRADWPLKPIMGALSASP